MFVCRRSKSFEPSALARDRASAPAMAKLQPLSGPRSPTRTYTWRRHDQWSAALPVAESLLQSTTASPEHPRAARPSSASRSPRRSSAAAAAQQPAAIHVDYGSMGLTVQQISPLSVAAQSDHVALGLMLRAMPPGSPPPVEVSAEQPCTRKVAMDRFIGMQMLPDPSPLTNPPRRGRGLGTSRTIPSKRLAPPSWSCAICLSSRWVEARLARLVCGHCFHVECLGQWTVRANLCPCCRQPLE